MVDSSVSLRLALVVWVALVPMLDAASVVVGGHRALVVETIECRPAQMRAAASRCGSSDTSTEPVCVAPPVVTGCEPALVSCASPQPSSSSANETAVGDQDESAPLPMSCLSCVCLSDLAMTATVVLSLTPQGTVSPPTDIVREDAPSRSVRPDVPPPKSLVLL